MADDTAQVEAMRQMLGAAFQQMGKDLEGFHKKAKEASSEGGGLFSLNTLITGMTKNLIGPVGLAAAVVSVAKSLESFSVGRIQLRNLSTDVGASIPLINAMGEAMKAAGISAEAQQQSIGRLGALVKDLAARGFGSELASMLLDTGHKANEIQQLIDTAKKNQDKAMLDTVEIFNQGNAQLRSYMATRAGIAESHLQAMKHTQEEMGKVYVADLEAAERYNKAWNSIALGLSNTWAMINDKAAQFVTKLPHEKLDQLMGQTEKGFKPDSKSIFGRALSGDWSSNPSSAPSFDDRFGKWPNELLDVERSSDKSLLEIRDSLMRMEMGEGGAGSGSGMGGVERRHAAEVPGGGRAMLGQRTGIGATRSGGGSGGITAPAGTPIQREGMATVSTPDGKKLQVDARFKDNFQGFINDYYKAGGTFGPSTGTLGERPSNASGHPIGDAIDVNQVGYGIRSKTGNTLPTETEDALAAKWGMVSGNQWRRPDTGHFGIKSQQAAREALVKNGMLPSDAEKEVASRSVKGSWFDDHVTASGADASKVAGIALPSREGLGKMHEVIGPDGRKMMLPQIDVGPAKWTGRGIDFSKPAMQQMGSDPTDKKFSYRRSDGNTDEARQAIDRTQSLSQRIDASMSATVDFRNMPSWVKSSVDDNGKFKNLRVSRSTPQAGKASSANNDLQPWSYE